MKRKQVRFLMVTASLASLLLLAACGSREKTEPSASSSQEPVTTSTSRNQGSSQTSSSGRSNASKGSSAASDSTGSDTGTGSSSSSSQSSREYKEAEPAPVQIQEQNPTQGAQAGQGSQSSRTQGNNQRYKGVLALADGDFSKAAGTWQDNQGNLISIDGSGSISIQAAGQEARTYSVASYSYTLDDGKYTAQLASADAAGGNPSLQIVTGTDGNVTSVQILK